MSVPEDGQRFWERVPLTEMSRDQWESLCDRCGRCCLIKLQPEADAPVAYTRVVCHLFDEGSCSCTRYAERSRLVPDCLHITPDNVGELDYLPTSCAYRRLAEGRPLPDWHPLLSGRQASVAEAGIAVAGRVISERHVHPGGLDEHVIEWVEQ